MAVATIWILAYGTRMEEPVEDRTIQKAIEDAMEKWPGSANSTSRSTPMPRSGQRDRRQVSLFRLVLLTFARQILCWRPRQRLFLGWSPLTRKLLGVKRRDADNDRPNG